MQQTIPELASWLRPRAHAGDVDIAHSRRNVIEKLGMQPSLVIANTSANELEVEIARSALEAAGLL